MGRSKGLSLSLPAILPADPFTQIKKHYCFWGDNEGDVLMTPAKLQGSMAKSAAGQEQLHR